MGDGRGGRSGGGGRELSRGDGRGQPSNSGSSPKGGRQSNGTQGISKGKDCGRGNRKTRKKSDRPKSSRHPTDEAKVSRNESNKLIENGKSLSRKELDCRVGKMKQSTNEQLKVAEKYRSLNKKLPKITEIDWEHNFKCDWNKFRDEITGYHSTYLHPEYVDRMITLPNKHGVYNATVRRVGKLKVEKSTMFPNHWSGPKIIEKTVEVYGNPVRIKNYPTYCEIYGKTKEGIMIKMIIDNNGVLKPFRPFIGELPK